MKRIAACMIMLALLANACSQSDENAEQAGMTQVPIEDIYQFAAGQLTRTVEQMGTADRFPFYTKSDGTWETEGSSWWSSGFFPGCLWLMYEYTEDDKWMTDAVKWTEGMAPEQYNTSDGDSGYRMMSSYGQAYRITHDDRYREVLLNAAKSYSTLYNAKVGALKSFTSDPWTFPVIVDHMMNLELLFWGAENGGDPAWKEMATSHALTTLRNHVRMDGSTIQLVDYDPDTGEVRGTDSLLGYDDESCWSRGQAEAFYGFAIAFHYTRDERFLDASEKLADYFIDNLPPDMVPYWDFNAPDIPNTVKDASATAMAADGLLLLSSLVSDVSAREKYHQAALDMLASICSPEYLAKGTNSMGILIHSTWRQPDQPAVDTSLIWGDYNLLEALMKYRYNVGML